MRESHADIPAPTAHVEEAVAPDGIDDLFDRLVASLRAAQAALVCAGSN